MTLLQCLVIFGYIATLLYSQIKGVENSSLESAAAATDYVSLGTAIFLAIIFGFVAYVAISTLRGRPKGAGAVVLIEAILLGVAFYMFQGGVLLAAVATALSAVIVLVCMLHPVTRQFQEAVYRRNRGL